jgi:1-acyl-sn-glycerol-3-phosphate acyltransferase
VQLGVEFPTDWARRPVTCAVRDIALAGVVAPIVRASTHLSVRGVSNLDGHSTMILTANHVSHLDTPLVLSALPLAVRRRIVVAAAVDTFFLSPVKAVPTALLFNGIPIERHKVNRRSAEDAQRLIEAGWHILIYPEGGRTTTGDLMEFKGGAAFLAEKTGAVVVPTFHHGAGELLGPRYAKADVYRRGPNRLHHVTVAFGPALHLLDGETVRRYGPRIREAVAVLGREVTGDETYGVRLEP